MPHDTNTTTHVAECHARHVAANTITINGVTVTGTTPDWARIAPRVTRPIADNADDMGPHVDMCACESCGDDYHVGAMSEVWGGNPHAGMYCEACADEVTQCDVCGCDITVENINDDEYAYIDDDMFCMECVASCESCGTTCRHDDVRSVRNRYGFYLNWCENCAGDGASYCEDCTDMCEDSVMTTSDVDDVARCTRCHTAHINDTRADDDDDDANDNRYADDVMAYHSDVRRQLTRRIVSEWTRAHNRMLGVELEVERHADSLRGVSSVARDALAMVNTNMEPITGVTRTLFAEYDGSLQDGCEFITQPMGLDMHHKMWPMLCDAISANMRSHDTTTCGLHVHVSRYGMTSMHIAKVVMFINDARNADMVKMIARRYNNGYCRRKEKTLRHYASTEKYEMVNTAPRDTIEFRIFRGSTRAVTVLACIEFAHAVVSWAKDASIDALNVREFLTWVWRDDNAHNTRNLRHYIASRLVTYTNNTSSNTIAQHVRDITGKDAAELLRARRCPTSDNNTNYCEL